MCVCVCRESKLDLELLMNIEIGICINFLITTFAHW